MKAAVVGGGAMGAAFAAEAVDAGCDVVVIDVAAHVVQEIRDAGVRVEYGSTTLQVRVPATTDATAVGQVDLAIVFVKGHHTRAAADTVASLLGPDSLALTLQNGWGNADILASVLPPAQLLMGVTYHSCSSTGPGRVRHTGRGRTVIGSYQPGGGTDAAERVAAFLTSAGWQAEASPDVRTEIWRKLILNAATLPTAALTRLPAGQLAVPGPLLELVDALATEAVAVAAAQGLNIELAERIDQIHAVLAAAGAGKASMLQDVEAARKTEIEAVNGAVARMGAELGIDTPLNRAMSALVGGMERSWHL
jgi:2-dehydropantoate 2-reductase